MLVDVNLLLFAIDIRSPHQAKAGAWLDEALSGNRRVGIPWQTITAFVRITTDPRIGSHPLSAAKAWGYVQEWLGCAPVWIPAATEQTARVFADLIGQHPVTGNLVPDAALAALAIENGLAVYSADTDFGRFPSVSWVNPIA